MRFDLLITLVGMAVLLGGGDIMVRGASALARRLGVSSLAIGLTVVAFGTSAPELAVNVTAAWRGAGEMSFGNIFGSNMANIGLIVASAALVQPLQIKSLVIRREVPMMMLATAVAAALGLDALLADRGSHYDRGDGIALLLLFTVFVYYTVTDLLLQRRQDSDGSTPRSRRARRRGPGLTRSLALTVGGLAGVVIGARLTVEGAVDLARGLGVSEAVIGLTLVAVGTSLPELATSLVASWKGHADLAIGNVVGSNIFNLLLVLGATATVGTVPVPVGGAADLAVVGGLSLLLWATSASSGRTIIRAEAILLLALYAGYLLVRSLA